jgi:hypothetical protein
MARSSGSTPSWLPSMKESLHFAGLRQHISAQCNSAWRRPPARWRRCAADHGGRAGPDGPGPCRRPRSRSCRPAAGCWWTAALGRRGDAVAATEPPPDAGATTKAARPAPTRVPTSVPMAGRSMAKPAPNPAATLPVMIPAARILGSRHRSNPGVCTWEAGDRSARRLAARNPISKAGRRRLLMFWMVLPGARLPVSMTSMAWTPSWRATSAWPRPTTKAQQRAAGESGGVHAPVVPQHGGKWLACADPAPAKPPAQLDCHAVRSTPQDL